MRIASLTTAPHFEVFDGNRYDSGRNRAYCLRCESWVPTAGPFSGSLDPHIEDHLLAYMMMVDVDEGLQEKEWQNS